ncbi:tripartite tricarboxylate transporter TctB family protein [Planktomarina temperata]|nr:tripartite tricarboxylate transporter TctB family protein [Planktomarina temperata]MDC0138688.1 tripartite tricarboxylate transporter TctB family protein [Planktomarina temperata]
MDKPDPLQAPRIVTSIWPAVLLLVFALVTFVVAQGYSATSARFPSMVAGAMIVLSVYDIWSRTNLPGANTVKTFGGTGFRQREMMHNPSFANQAECLGWITGAFAMMAAIGILAASPIFCASYVRFKGNRSFAVSVGVGIGVLIFQLAVFEWALNYELYRGLFFTKGGVSAW